MGDLNERVPGSNIMIFNTEEEQDEYQVNENDKLRYVEPHVSFITENEKVKYNKCVVLKENCGVWNDYFKAFKAECKVPMTHDDYDVFKNNIVGYCPIFDNHNNLIGFLFFVAPIKNANDPDDDGNYTITKVRITEDEHQATITAFCNMKNDTDYGITKSVFICPQFEVMYIEGVEVMQGTWFDLKCQMPTK